MKTEASFLGVVRRVVGSKVFVELSGEIPSASPIIHGRVYRLGQIGSFVRIPLGFLNLYGVVSMVGSSEIVGLEEEAPSAIRGQRWIEVQLVGESYGREEFSRGVSIFPTLDDEVHIVTEDDLAIIYGGTGAARVPIGTHSTSESLAATVDLDKIVTRHAAIVGSTGSGKSNAVCSLLRSLTSGDYPSTRIIVIDPHGEYAPAFAGRSRVFRIGDQYFPLCVPHWALSFDELAWFLVDRRSGSESLQDTALRDKIFEFRKGTTHALRAGAIEQEDITPDSPVPFNLRQLWYDLDRPERVTYKDNDRTQEALVEEGNPLLLKPAVFEPHSPYNKPPFKAQVPVPMQTYANRILARLKDRRFDFLLSPSKFDGIEKDLHDLMKDWIDHEYPLTILDLGGIPFEIIDLVVGVLTRVVFEGMFWGRDLPGTGRQRPLLIVFEEAHSYLPRSEARFIQGFARQSVQRIFKEGRKYGIGAIVISQRPSELDETILSQCGTFFAMRLSNSDDQGRVKSTVPDALAGLIDLLPALRTGEALVLGEAMQIPSRVRITLVEPRPKSNDPEVSKCWQESKVADVAYDKAVTGWRCQRLLGPTMAGPPDEETSDG